MIMTNYDNSPAPRYNHAMYVLVYGFSNGKITAFRVHVDGVQLKRELHKLWNSFVNHGTQINYVAWLVTNLEGKIFM